MASFNFVSAIFVSAVVSPKSEAISCTTRICFSITLFVTSTVRLTISSRSFWRYCSWVMSRITLRITWYSRS